VDRRQKVARKMVRAVVKKTRGRGRRGGADIPDRKPAGLAGGRRKKHGTLECESKYLEKKRASPKGGAIRPGDGLSGGKTSSWGKKINGNSRPATSSPE